MDTLLYLIVRVALAVIWLLPLEAVAWLGRVGGAIAFRLDRRHRRVAIENLAATVLAGQPADVVKRVAGDNFKRIGENFACAARTAAMPQAELKTRYEVEGGEPLLRPDVDQPDQPPKWVVAIGHFGNFELYARFGHSFPRLRPMSTYRGIPNRALDRLLRQLRDQSGCRFFERRTEANALKVAMNEPGALLGLLCDQHAGKSGLRLPFLGKECSTSAAPAVFALRYHCRLTTAVCQRIGPARWRFVIGPEIATHVDGQARSTTEIMSDVNRVFEAEIRRDPTNWFWVHRRWKK